MNIKQYRHIKVNRQVIVKYLPRVSNRGKGKNKVISEDLSPCIFDIRKKYMERAKRKKAVMALGLCFLYWIAFRVYVAMRLSVLTELKSTGYVLNEYKEPFGAATLFVLLSAGYCMEWLKCRYTLVVGGVSAVVYTILDAVVIKRVYSYLISSPIMLDMLTEKGIYRQDYTGELNIWTIVTSVSLYGLFYIVGIFLRKVSESTAAYKLYVLVSFIPFVFVSILLDMVEVFKQPVLYAIMGIMNPLVGIMSEIRSIELIKGEQMSSIAYIESLQVLMYSLIGYIELLIAMQAVLPKQIEKREAKRDEE